MRIQDWKKDRKAVVKNKKRNKKKRNNTGPVVLKIKRTHKII